MEKFAVDLDAVLDEFELNEDQAEVAAARLQKQIEQGRLEIASSETTPASSYTNSPRTSFAHLQEEHGRTVSPLVQCANLAEPVAVIASGTGSGGQRSTLVPTNNQLHVSVPPAGGAKVSECPPPREAANDGRLPATHVADSTAAFSVARGSALSGVRLSGVVSGDEGVASRVGATNGGVLSRPVAGNAAPASSRPSGITSASRSGDANPPGPAETFNFVGSNCTGRNPLPSHEKVPEPAAIEHAANASCDSSPSTDSDEHSRAAVAVSRPERGSTAQTVDDKPILVPPTVTRPDPVAVGGDSSQARSASESAGPDVALDASRPGGGANVVLGGPGASPVAVETGPAPEEGAERPADAGTSEEARSPESATSAAPSPAEDVAPRRPESSQRSSAELPAPAANGPCAAPSPPPAMPNGPASMSPEPGPTPRPDRADTVETTAAVAPQNELAPAPGPREPAEEAAVPAAVAPEPQEPVGAGEPHAPEPEPEPQPEPEPEPEPEPKLEPEPGPEPEPEPGPGPGPGSKPEPEPEPVRFQPADDVSDSELETYLQQLEDNPPPEPADGALTGARPKTAPPAAAPAEPPAPPAPAAGLETLKGGVISRLQSQVSIECEVDSRSARPPPEPGRASPAPPPPPPAGAAPVRPSSLDLPSRSQSIAEDQETSEPAAEPAGPQTDEAGEPGGQRPAPADDAAPSVESVSTTGGNIVTAPGAYEEARLAAGRAPAASGRGQLVSLSDEDKNLGKVAPVWVPDEDAAACMECEQKFTVIRRRHHCRACGRVLCSACCSERIPLDYMEFREGRVCIRCKRTIDRVEQESRVAAAAQPTAHHQRARPPNPNNPMEYCSTVPPTQQATPNAPPPTVMVPTGVLKRAESSGGRTPSREAKQVMFSDGIRPGGDLTEPASGRPAARGADPALCRPPHRRTARLARGSDRSPAAILKDAKGCKDLSWKPDSGKLPPIYQAGSAGSTVKQSTPEETIVSMIRAERDLSWSFLINKNLMVAVKMFKLDCCVGRTCWIFTSHGLCTVGQEEVVVILESLPDEANLPKDVFFFYHHLFAEAAKGNFVTELGHTLFTVPFLGSKEHGGFLYLRPTFQCLHNIPYPPQPFLVAVLIQKWEAPWAKVFPLRLLLRLGAEFRYYPCPLVSVRHRKPVFFEVGHTIINLLADFRNFAYVLPTVHGMHIHMEEQQTSVLIPRNRFNQVLKAINNSNDHVLALGASFSREADSHLVCMQNEDGQYQTQAINIQNRPRQVTGASFIVFNGALKSASGVTAKSSIVEDGLMFQISSDTMQTLRGCLRQMQDYKIECGPVGEPPDEVISIKWVEDDRSHNLGVRSVIDDKPLDGVPSIRIHNGTDYVADAKLIRWTEVYLIKVSESVARSGSEPPDFSRLAEEVARGTCVALTPHLALLAESDRTRVGLRATVDADVVGYEAGSNCGTLPPACMNLLDSELVPVLHRYAAEVPDSPVCLELLFHVIDR